MATHRSLDFSNDGSLFAQSTADGTIKIWDTITGKMVQTYTPSAHLSATCTCLAWHSVPSVDHDGHKSKKKKLRKSSLVGSSLQLLAIGTTSGDLLLFSHTKGDLHCRLTGGHGGIVNTVAWLQNDDVIYSGSADQHVVEWQVSSASVSRKWKADKTGVTAITVCRDNKHLLTAGRKLKLWDLQAEHVLQVFTGHASEVSRLLHVPLATAGEGDSPSITQSYFISAAVDDRMLNVWHATSDSKTQTAVATMALDSPPVSMDIKLPAQSDEAFRLACATVSGHVNVYSHVLNGRLSKPLQPKSHITIATGGENARPLPVICVKNLDDLEQSVILAYTAGLRPVFERLASSRLNEDVCLIRDDVTSLGAAAEAHLPDTLPLKTNGDVTVLTPGHMTPLTPALSEGQSGGDAAGAGRRKRRKSTELSLAERLHAVGLDPPETTSTRTHPPKTDALAALLAQGLQSNDKKILNTVLQNRTDSIIRNTVRRIPVAVIVPLVQELTKRMQGHAQSGHALVRWLRMVLTVHTSYLMTYPEIVAQLGSLYQMMDSRVSLFSRLSKLQGKLDLMLSQITAQTQTDEDDPVTSQTALLTYQDDSSDDEFLPMGDISVADISEAEDMDDDVMSDDDENDSGNNSSGDNNATYDVITGVSRNSDDDSSMDDDDEG